MATKLGHGTKLDLSIEYHQLSSDSSRYHHHHDSHELKQEQMTIFYNGRICVCNVAVIQARAIISMAKQVMEDTKNHCPSQQSREEPSSPQTSSSSSQVLPQLLGPKLSMKLSLQRFLVKRQRRIMDSSPYRRRHKLPF